MAFPKLSKSHIQEHTAGGSFERGQEYFADGAVRSLTQINDDTLKASVQGQDVHPYLVTIRFDEDDVTKVTCSCPYYEGTWCKHVVAVLLKTLDTEKIPRSESAAVAEMVENMDRAALVTLIERLVEHDPSLLEQIEQERARLVEE